VAGVALELIHYLLVLVLVRSLANRVLEHSHKVVSLNKSLVFKVLVAHQEQVNFALTNFVPEIQPLQASVLKVLLGASAVASREDTEE